jgi:hypothetical protein
MVEIADILRQHGPAYLAKYGDRMLASHKKAIKAILQCRTKVLGGHVFHCDKCDCEHYSYHSCKNRHCPKCQHQDNEAWLGKQLELLLPVTYFMVTFTLPAELRQLARSNQKIIYNIFFRTSAAALMKLALDPRFIGGKIGMVGVLQTWKRDLHFHPHIHYIVPGGGLSADGKRWLSSRDDFLVPVEALSVIFRAKFRDELKRTELFEKISADVWKKVWVVHCEAVGNGEDALKYVADYINRIAISNHRIIENKEDVVSFKYKDSDTKQWKTPTIPAEEFIRRFLQHVLPDRFVKVRYYGLLAPKNRKLLNKAKQLLGVESKDCLESEQKSENDDQKPGEKTIPCPKCGTLMKWVRQIPREVRRPP